MSQPPDSPVKKVLQPVGCCVGCFGVVIGIPILLVLIAYGIIFHTTIPLRLVLNNMESDPAMQFKGVRGSVSKGFSIKEWVIKNQNGADDSRIEDLTFRYNGIVDAIQHQRLIIDEISVAQADFVVGPDFMQSSEKDNESNPTNADERPDHSTDPSSEPDVSSSPDEPFKNDFEFELKTLHLEKVRIRSSDNQFELAIPLLQLDAVQFKDKIFSLNTLDIKDFQLRLPKVGPTQSALSGSQTQPQKDIDLAIPLVHVAGLGVTPDRLDLAEFAITSNVVSLVLEEAQPQTINGEVIPYSRRLRGRISPTANEFILRPFDFTLDFAKAGDRIISRFIGFSGAVEQVTFPSGGSFIRTKAFSPGDYFALSSDLVPQRCSLLSISKPSGPESQPESIQSTMQGDCYWGATQFRIPPQVGDTLVTHGQVQNYAIRLTLRSTDQNWVPMMEFISDPPLPLLDILALVYFQQRYDQLNQGARSRIDALQTELALH